MLMEQRSEEERSQRGRHRGQTEKGNITNEPEERGSAESRGKGSRQRNILAGYMQYELLPKNIKNLLAGGQWRLNTNHGPRAQRIASRIIGLYCCTYELVYAGNVSYIFRLRYCYSTFEGLIDGWNSLHLASHFDRTDFFLFFFFLVSRRKTLNLNKTNVATRRTAELIEILMGFREPLNDREN